MENLQLPYLSDQDKLGVYQTIIGGCQHLYSKGKIQEDKVLNAIKPLVKLGQDDPYFLAHLTSWIVSNGNQNRDLQISSIYANALSSADGTPFSKGSAYKKPNLRYISVAALQGLAPKEVGRVREFGSLKFSVPKILRQGSHFPQVLKTAIRKYLQYREANLPMVKGIKKGGLGNIYKRLYRSVHLSPSDEVAAILRWNQKDGRDIKIEKSAFDFKGLSDLQIAKKIRKDRLPVLGAVGALERMSPVIAVALLEQATGNQAVILRKTFEDMGVLKDKDVLSLYRDKVSTAKTAIDRVETLSKSASEEVKKVLKDTRAKVRKKEMAGLGKVFLHIDFSISMQGAIEFAKEKGAIISECVDSPEENFRWGSFGERAEMLPLPEEFVADAFQSVLFGKKADQGYTNCYGCYPMAREFGADYDIFVTDQGHNAGDLTSLIEKYHVNNANISKPKGCLIVQFSGETSSRVKDAYEENGIPVAVIQPEILTESALVAQSLKEAIKGPMVVIEEIMNTPLLRLPEWYLTI